MQLGHLSAFHSGSQSWGLCVCVFRVWGPLTGLLSQSQDWAVSGGRVCLARRWSAPAELGHESRLCWGAKSLCLKVLVCLKFWVLCLALSSLPHALFPGLDLLPVRMNQNYCDRFNYKDLKDPAPCQETLALVELFAWFIFYVP